MFLPTSTFTCRVRLGMAAKGIEDRIVPRNPGIILQCLEGEDERGLILRNDAQIISEFNRGNSWGTGLVLL